MTHRPSLLRPTVHVVWLVLLLALPTRGVRQVVAGPSGPEHVKLVLVAVPPDQRQLSQGQVAAPVRVVLLVTAPERVLRPLPFVLWPLLRPVAPPLLLEPLAEGEPVWLPHPPECVRDALLGVVEEPQRLLLAVVLLLFAVAVPVRARQLRLLVVGLPHLLVAPLLPPVWPVLQVVLAPLGWLGRRGPHEVVHLSPLLRLALPVAAPLAVDLLARLLTHEPRWRPFLPVPDPVQEAGGQTDVLLPVWHCLLQLFVGLVALVPFVVSVGLLLPPPAQTAECRWPLTAFAAPAPP